MCLCSLHGGKDRAEALDRGGEKAAAFSGRGWVQSALLAVKVHGVLTALVSELPAALQG